MPILIYGLIHTGGDTKFEILRLFHELTGHVSLKSYQLPMGVMAAPGSTYRMEGRRDQDIGILQVLLEV